ncbi:MAG: hypothetical protein Q8O64_09180 [Sideroxyarcus sp.]|nr:hypothetical protein [Sideroxyarcus sp.]
MKRHQTGEAMLAVMVVMLAIAFFSHGHRGMMGHGRGHTAHAAETAPQNPTTPAPKPAPGESAEPHR